MNKSRLKKQTGLYIAAERLAQLSAEIAFRKAEQAAEAEAEEHLREVVRAELTR